MPAFSASFILLAKIKRESSMSEKPFGGALRLEVWLRMAGILTSGVELYCDFVL